MLFSLEAVFAKHGDALILHYGSEEDPKWVLIDGGPRGVYKRYLLPRFEQLREEWDLEKQSFPLEMVMVSHVDDDHINGILALFDGQLDAHDKRQRLPFKIRRLWHNSFDDIVAKEGEDVVTALADEAKESGATSASLGNSSAIIQSVKQGRELRQAATKLGMTKVNSPFDDLVTTAASSEEIDLGADMSFLVLGPDAERVDSFRTRWKKDLKKILAKEEKAATAQSMTDGSPFNLASIVVLAKMNGKTMLLTGDARGDYIEDGLESAGLLTDSGSFHVDLLKVPHHGSNNNVTREFFERVTADHYVISGDRPPRQSRARDAPDDRRRARRRVLHAASDRP